MEADAVDGGAGVGAVAVVEDVVVPEDVAEAELVVVPELVAVRVPVVFAARWADAVDAFGVAPGVRTTATCSRRASVIGPFSPGGAPPGSGTAALGSDGSGSLTPGWLGPSLE